MPNFERCNIFKINAYISRPLKNSMKDRSKKYLTFFFIVGMCSMQSLLAQEGGFMFGEEDIKESVAIPTSPGSERVYHKPVNPEVKKKAQKESKAQEGKQSNLQETKKPQTSEGEKRQSNPAIDTTNKEEDPDSVLSFNFLYYIIHKFKFSDVLDE